MQHLDAPAWRPAFNDAAINPARLFRVSSELVNGRANSRLAWAKNLLVTWHWRARCESPSISAKPIDAGRAVGNHDHRM